MSMWFLAVCAMSGLSIILSGVAVYYGWRAKRDAALLAAIKRASA